MPALFSVTPCNKMQKTVKYASKSILNMRVCYRRGIGENLFNNCVRFFVMRYLTFMKA